MAKKIDVVNAFKQYGFKNILISWDTVIFMSIAIITYIAIPYLHLNNRVELLRNYVGSSISVSGGILAIVIGALAIVLSMMSNEFLSLIHKINAYNDFMIPYLTSSIIWAFKIFLDFTLLVITFMDSQTLNSLNVPIKVLISISIGLLVSGLFGLVELVITAIKLGTYRSRLFDKSNN